MKLAKRSNGVTKPTTTPRAKRQDARQQAGKSDVENLSPEVSKMVHGIARHTHLTPHKVMELLLTFRMIQQKEEQAVEMLTKPDPEKLLMGIASLPWDGEELAVTVPIKLSQIEWFKVTLEAKHHGVTIGKVLSDVLTGQYDRAPGVLDVKFEYTAQEKE